MRIVSKLLLEIWFPVGERKGGEMSTEITLAKFGEMVAVKYSPQFLIPGSFKSFIGKFKLGCKGEIDVAPKCRFGW